MKQTSQQRFAVLGAFLPLFVIFTERGAKELGWVPSKPEAIVFAIAIGLVCVAGGVIAYRTTQVQVRRDLDEVRNAGRTQR